MLSMIFQTGFVVDGSGSNRDVAFAAGKFAAC
jgi:hypothetical protein